MNVDNGSRQPLSCNCSLMQLVKDRGYNFAANTFGAAAAGGGGAGGGGGGQRETETESRVDFRPSL